MKTTMPPPAEPEPEPEPEPPAPEPEPPPPEPAAPPPEPAAPKPPEPAVEPPPPPALAPLLSAEETVRFNREIDAQLARARRNLETLGERSLSPAQRLQRDRVVAFIEQTSTLRRRDLSAARNLARRAAVLSQSLIDNVR